MVHLARFQLLNISQKSKFFFILLVLIIAIECGSVPTGTVRNFNNVFCIKVISVRKKVPDKSPCAKFNTNNALKRDVLFGVVDPEP
jgi:hypothetical protein